MGKIVYREFLGNRILLLIMWLSVIGIPWAVLYILESTVTVEEELESPSEFLDAHRQNFKSGVPVRHSTT